MGIINFFLSTDISLGLGIFENICLFINKFGSNRPGIIFDSNLNNNDYFTKTLEVINKKYPNGVNNINNLKGDSNKTNRTNIECDHQQEVEKKILR